MHQCSSWRNYSRSNKKYAWSFRHINPGNKLKQILIYVRPWNREQFIDLAEKVFPNSRLTVLSDHASADSSGFAGCFGGAYERQEQPQNDPLWTKLDIDDIILRCRLLRNIDRLKAERLVNAMAVALENLAECTSFDAILCLTTDCYIQHVMVVFAQSAGMPFIGLVPTFVDGYFRITKLGELNECRDVSPDENEYISNKLFSVGYRPSFICDPDMVRWNARKEWAATIARYIYFSVKRLHPSNKLNYHFFANVIFSKKFLSALPQTYSGLNLFALEGLAERCGAPLVYVPLQMAPEATIDYWSSDTTWINYESRLLAMVDEYRTKSLFVVKEHPNVLGRRTPGFYRKLAQRENVVLMDPTLDSNSILGLCDATFICTGSVGFEAFLRGIPVLSDSDPWHLPGLTQPISALRGAMDFAPPSRKCVSDGIKILSRGILPGKFNNNGTWDLEKDSQEKVAESISDAIPYLKAQL